MKTTAWLLRIGLSALMAAACGQDAQGAFSSSVCGIHAGTNENAPTPRRERLSISRLLNCLRGPVADAMPL